MTASLALYQELNLPLPWNPAKGRLPLIIYGGSSAVGAFAIKLAVLSNIHPIAAVAGKGGDFTRSLLDESKGDVVIDYRKGHDHIVNELRKVVGNDATRAFDAVSEKGSTQAIGEVLGQGGQIATVLTPEMVVGGRVDTGQAQILFTLVGRVHPDSPSRLTDDRSALLGDPEFGAVFFHFIGLALAQRRLSGHPVEVVDKGLLNGVETALGLLQGGKLSAKKAVIRIATHEWYEKIY